MLSQHFLNSSSVSQNVLTYVRLKHTLLSLSRVPNFHGTFCTKKQILNETVYIGIPGQLGLQGDALKKTKDKKEKCYRQKAQHERQCQKSVYWRKGGRA